MGARSGEFERLANGSLLEGFLVSSSGDGLGPMDVGVDLAFEPALVSRVGAAATGCVVLVRVRVVDFAGLLVIVSEQQAGSQVWSRWKFESYAVSMSCWLWSMSWASCRSWIMERDAGEHAKGPRGGRVRGSVT